VYKLRLGFENYFKNFEIKKGEDVDQRHLLNKRARTNANKNVVANRVARFFLAHGTKTGKMYQMNTKCTKTGKMHQMSVKYSIPNDHKIYPIYPNLDF
jgi:hypothetical protein